MTVARRGEVSCLSHRRHLGPILVQKAHYPEGPRVCHLHLIHPPGGLVGGDRVTVQIRLEEAAHALLTTPAAGKLYRSGGERAELVQSLHVGPGALLEWLPQENILFESSDGLLRTDVHLNGGRFFGWEVVALGRPACGIGFGDGRLRQEFDLYRDAEPVLLERLRLSAGDGLIDAAWGLDGAAAFGTLVMAPGADDAADRARELLAQCEGLHRRGVTAMDGMLICRAAAGYAEPVRVAFERLWVALRPGFAGLPACPPRIWKT